MLMTLARDKIPGLHGLICACLHRSALHDGANHRMDRSFRMAGAVPLPRQSGACTGNLRGRYADLGKRSNTSQSSWTMHRIDPRIVAAGAFIGLLLAGAGASWLDREMSALVGAIVASAVAELVAIWWR